MTSQEIMEYMHQQQAERHFDMEAIKRRQAWQDMQSRMAQQLNPLGSLFGELAARGLSLPVRAQPAPAPSMTPTLDKLEAEHAARHREDVTRAVEFLAGLGERRNTTERIRPPLTWATKTPFDPFAGFGVKAFNCDPSYQLDEDPINLHPMQRLSTTDTALVDPMHALLAVAQLAEGPRPDAAQAGLAAAGTR